MATALISHGTATSLWGLTKRFGDEVQVTVVGRQCRSRAGISVHRVQRLDPLDRSRKNGIPVTLPARALVNVLRAELRREGGPRWTRREGEEPLAVAVVVARALDVCAGG